MLSRCLKKMYKNKWIYLALQVGLILSIIVIVVIPMYSRAAQDRAFREKIRDYNMESNEYPLTLKYSYKNRVSGLTEEYIKKCSENSLYSTEKYGLPILEKKELIHTSDFLFWNKGDDVKEHSGKIITGFNIISMKEIEDKINILEGRMVSDEPKDDVLEVIIHKDIYNGSKLSINEIYSSTLESTKNDVVEALNESNNEEDMVHFKIVGVYEQKKDDYWMSGVWHPGDNYLLTNYENHMQILRINNKRYDYINEYYLDYSNLKYSQVKGSEDSLIRVFEKNNSYVSKDGGKQEFPLTEIAEEIEEKMESTVSMLIIIFFPLIIMLGIYVLMLSNIIADSDSNEISLLKSRGANLKDLFSTYICQGAIMGSIGLIIGPLISKKIVEVMGLTTEFLEFGQVGILKGYINFTDYIFAFIVIVFFTIAMIIPVYIKAKKSIVEIKRDKMRVSEKSIWKRYFIDIIVLIFSSYGFYNFLLREESEIKSATDPIMYFLITGMCLGLSLLFLRIYPYIIKSLFKVGKRVWKPEVYYLLINESRDSSKKEYIMFFLVFSLSIGVFNMNAARKLNREGEHNISYINGADIVVRERWSDYLMSQVIGNPIENRYENVAGVEEVTKVLTRKNMIMKSEDAQYNKFNMMAIEPHKFGEIAWHRSDLYPRHWYDYLNALTETPSGVLVSNSVLERGFNVGDEVVVGIPSIDFEYSALIMEVYDVPSQIIGTFDYWPGWDSEEDEYLVVINYNNAEHYIEELLKYDVWIKKDENIGSDEVLASMTENGIKQEISFSIDKEVEAFRENIFVQTINGAYSFAFIMTLTITFIGFIVYWILSIKQRTLQFGIIRALGMEKTKIYKMIFLEQMLATLLTFGIGTYIGSKIFSIVGALTNNEAIQGKIELPIMIEYVAKDYLNVFLVVSAMIIIVILIISLYISKLKINQVIKLGED